MPTMNISLPDPMKEFVEKQVADGGYSSASEYVRELLRAEQKRRARDEIEQKLLASLNSGEPIPITPEWWDSLRDELRQKAARKRKREESRGRIKNSR